MIERFTPKVRPEANILEADKKLDAGNESGEYIPSIKTVTEFLDLSEEDLEVFKQRLMEAQGHLRIWVHPLYTEQWPGTVKGRLGDADLAEVQNQLRTSFLKTTSSVAANLHSSPLVVYEAVKKLEETRNLIATHLQSDPQELKKLGIIFIPTESSSSALDQAHLIKSLQSGDEGDRVEAQKLIEFRKASDDFRELSNKHFEETEAILGSLTQPLATLTTQQRQPYQEMKARQVKEMKPVMDKYREVREKSRLEGDDFMLSLYTQIGLKSALVSGAYLEVGDDYKTKEKQLQACAGGVVNKLRNAGIPTDISKNIWPPKELIKAAGLEFKQTERDSNR